MSDDDDYYYEEETTHVVFDTGLLSNDDIQKSIRATGGCRLIGLEEGKPFLQIGDATFEGAVDETLGTHLMFEYEERKADTSGLLPLLTSIRSDADIEPKPPKYTVNYTCLTNSVIKMDSVQLQPKTEDKKNTLASTVDTDEGDVLFD